MNNELRISLLCLCNLYDFSDKQDFEGVNLPLVTMNKTIDKKYITYMIITSLLISESGFDKLELIRLLESNQKIDWIPIIVTDKPIWFWNTLIRVDINYIDYKSIGDLFEMKDHHSHPDWIYVSEAFELYDLLKWSELFEDNKQILEKLYHGIRDALITTQKIMLNPKLEFYVSFGLEINKDSWEEIKLDITYHVRKKLIFILFTGIFGKGPLREITKKSHYDKNIFRIINKFI